MIGRGQRTKSSGFDYRGAHELARFSRCIWTQDVFQIGRLVIPLASWRMREEIMAMRGPTALGQVPIPAWGNAHEHAYQHKLLTSPS